MKNKALEMANDLALASLQPGPAAFLHRYLWDKIHAINSSHGKKGIYGANMALPMKLMIEDIYTKWRL